FCAKTRPRQNRSIIGVFEAPGRCLSPESRPILMAHNFGGPCTSTTSRGTLRVMNSLPPPLAFVVLLFAGWVNRQQQAAIDYLLEKNRVLPSAHGPRRLRLTDDQRRRLG